MRRAALAAVLLLGCSRSSADRPALDLASLGEAVRARPPLALMVRRDPARSAKRVESNLRKQTADLFRIGWRSRDRPFPIQPPIDWSANPFRDRNWRFQLNSLDFLPPFLHLHEVTGDRAALAYARSILLDWSDFNLVRQRPNDFRWYDHSTGKRAIHLAYVLDRSLRRGELDDRQLRLLLDAARQHIRHLADPTELAGNNHALFQLAGLAALCRALPELDGCDRHLAWAQREFTRIVESQFNDEGIHTENSPSYQGYALESIDLMLSTGWLDLPPELRARLERAWVNLPWLVRPDGQFARIGDSSGDYGRVQRAIVRQRGGADQAATHRAFPAAGYAMVRVPSVAGPALDSYLFLTAAYNSKSHKHRDALSFEWHDAGVPILIDTGAYSANNDPGADYVRSSRAHNTIEVDGADIDKGKPRSPLLVATGQLGDLHAAAAEVAHAELAVRHRRILLLAPGRWLLVHDEVSADRPRTITAWFHLSAEAALRPAADAAGIAEIPGAGSLRVVDLTGRAAVAHLRGQSVPRLEGWVVGGYGKLVESDTIRLTAEGQTVTFDTLFLLGPGGAIVTPGATPGATPGVTPVAAPDLCWSDGRAVHGARVTVTGGAIELAPCPAPGAAASAGP